MNILFDIGHPAHVHLFRNFIAYLRDNKHTVVVTTRDKEITNILLDHYAVPYTSLSKPSAGRLGMMAELIQRDWNIYKLHLKHQFDAAYGTSVSIGHLSMISKVQSFNFNEDDDDIVPLYAKASYPFCTKIINPTCIRHNRWKQKRILLNSYHELAYLHPDHFQPDEQIVTDYGLKPYEYILIRTSSLKAHHDVGVKGLHGSIWDQVHTTIDGHQVVYSHEKTKKGKIKPWDMHHILACAKLIISDSQTMTMEAAVLGVPSIRYNSFVGRISCLEELEHDYHLTMGFLPDREEKKMIETIQSLLSDKTVKTTWQKRRNTLLHDKMNLNTWMIDHFENSVRKKSIT